MDDSRRLYLGEGCASMFVYCSTVANLQLRCRAHNAYEARLFFGDSVVRETRTAWNTSSFRNEFANRELRTASSL